MKKDASDPFEVCCLPYARGVSLCATTAASCPALSQHQVTLPGHTAPTKLAIVVTKTRAHKCPRCWRFVSHEADVVCERCQSVLRDDGHATEGDV